MSEQPAPVYHGCSDGGCIFGHPGGMHTNGGCNCIRTIRRPAALEDSIRIERGIRAMRDEIRSLRSQVGLTRTKDTLRAYLVEATENLPAGYTMSIEMERGRCQVVCRDTDYDAVSESTPDLSEDGRTFEEMQASLHWFIQEASA